MPSFCREIVGLVVVEGSSREWTMGSMLRGIGDPKIIEVRVMKKR